MGREIDFLNTIARPESSCVKRVRRLSVHHRSIAENEKLISQMTKLRALFHVNIDKKIKIKRLNNMFGRFNLLQVLIIELGNFPVTKHVCFSSNWSLSHLNSLKIESKYPFQIPWSIRNLKNFQTLDLQKCYSAVELPIGIRKMEQLRHLLLCGNYQLGSYLMRLLYQCHQVEVLLPNLQALVGIRCWDLRPHGLLKFTNLRELELWDVTPEIMEVLLCGPRPISRKLESLCCESLANESRSYCTMTRRVLSLVKYDRLVKLKIHSVHLPMQRPLELPPSLIKLTLELTALNDGLENTQKSAQTEIP